MSVKVSFPSLSKSLQSEGYLESSHFYRNHFYVEEELALFITEMIDHLSLFYLFGENCLKNNLEMEEALKTSIEFLKVNKN